MFKEMKEYLVCVLLSLVGLSMGEQQGIIQNI
jgi:hypothetical protein